MSEIVEITEWVLLIVGSIFALIGGLGLLRFPNFYARIHAVGVTDTLGAALILLACGLEAGATLLAAKLITAWGFLYLTGPAATHALAKAAHSSGLKVNDGKKESIRDVIPT